MVATATRQQSQLLSQRDIDGVSADFSVAEYCVLTLQGDHLQLLLQQVLGSRHSLPSHGVLMGLSAGLFLPTTWLPDLGALSYVGALGVVSAIGLTGIAPVS